MQKFRQNETRFGHILNFRLLINEFFVKLMKVYYMR